MKGKFLITLTALFLFAGVIPVEANGVPIQLGSLIPTGACVPTISTTCPGPTSVSVAVAGLGTITITGYSLFPSSSGNIGVTLDSNTAAQVPYLGIFGGNNEDEIDLETGGELLQISFSQPVVINSLDLNKLFLAGLRGDSFDEVAGISFFSGGLLLGTNFYPGTANGQLQVINPFGQVKIDTLQFWPNPTSNVTDASNSDFGVSALNATVPEPGTLVLFVSGLSAFAARRRLRRKIS